jgi:hypothetical protein
MPSRASGIVLFGQVDASWYPMKHQWKGFHHLSSNTVIKHLHFNKQIYNGNIHEISQITSLMYRLECFTKLGKLEIWHLYGLKIAFILNLFILNFLVIEPRTRTLPNPFFASKLWGNSLDKMDFLKAFSISISFQYFRIHLCFYSKY